ncbi:hypothetical protein C5Z26_05025 [Lactobacillus sp. CBA3606]|uniref:hypothetical protein n=1 Tax=Lactobacillus sp. CBA3606 TaxID=2099789 RepID=UPI000CFC36FD|nr:hypothetical protein [Lactobacillus sp. CBA3606]AVK63503.1 hypothetical protein C5Z26_05025 [Lactobacillus sp. CBA3606]
MRGKKLSLLLLPIIAIAALLIVHKANVDQRYHNFSVNTVHISPVANQLTPNVTLKSFSQYRKKNHYYASLTVTATKKMPFTLDHWYLMEGTAIQPNQFLTDDLTINGMPSTNLSRGTNVIKVNTQVDPQVQPNLVIVTNPAKGHYRKLVFKTLN